jgi:hypothetical protein
MSLLYQSFLKLKNIALKHLKIKTINSEHSESNLILFYCYINPMFRGNRVPIKTFMV